MRLLIQFITFYYLLYHGGMMTADTLLGSLTDDPGSGIINMTSFLDSEKSPFDSKFNPFSDEFDPEVFPATDLIDPDAYRNVSELITSKGYPCKEYTVQTADGYLLSVQRIPHGKNNNTQEGDKEVVLLVHGEAGDAKTWFLNPPGWGLGYILPDEDYDVWMVNNRGSVYSKRNIYYSRRSYEFWDFSFDEIAKYDLTATIDYILNATGKEALHVIGLSRGNTVGFVLLSEVPEYNKKVKLLVALSPIAYFGHYRSIMKLFIPFTEEIVLAINAVTHGEFLPINKALRIVIYEFCKVTDAVFCENLLFAVGGFHPENTNKTRVPIYTAQYLSSTSTKFLSHYAQLYRSKKFRKFDYGPKKNQEIYNQIEPPDYHLSRISSPVALFWSLNDIVGDPIDVDILRKQLKSLVFDYKVPDSKFTHLDFIWGINSPELIYKPLLKLLEEY